MNDLREFGFEGKAVRVVMVNDEPWWVGKDVCSFFGDTDHKRSLSRIDNEDKSILPITDSMNRSQEAVCINESGLYALLFGFQPEKGAKDGGAQNDPHIGERIESIRRFKRWVTHEVLPSIRKTGGYLSPAVDFSDPDKLQIVFDRWKEDRKKRLEAEARVERLVHNNRTYSTTEISKELGMKSAQELNQLLCEKGIQYKDRRGIWLLYADYADKGFQNIKQKEKDGVVIYYSEWTGLGRDWLLGLFSRYQRKERSM
jgi:prophage antirepressor-like protein